MMGERMRANGGAQMSGTWRSLHVPGLSRRGPQWPRLVPPGELPLRAVLVRLVLALVLATALWVGISSAQDPVREVTYHAVPVQVIPPPGYYPVHGVPPATVFVEGLSSDLKDAPRPVGIVDLSHTSSAVPQSVPVQVHGLPAEVEVVKVTPPTVRLLLETSASKTVPVVVQGIRTPPGYEVSLPAATPGTVKITGPSYVISRILEARVVLDESKLTHDEAQQVEPQVFDRSGQPVSRSVVLIQPGKVTVTVLVRARPVHQLVSIVPDITGSPALAYRITGIAVNPQEVEVVSSVQVPVTTTLTTTPIAVDGWTTSQIKLAQVVVPVGLTLSHAAQGIVTVTIDVSPAPGSATTTAQVLVVGRRPGTTVTLDQATVTVVYQGPLPRLARAGAPLAILDVHNRRPGVYDLVPSIKLPGGLALAALMPSHVRVVITASPQAAR